MIERALLYAAELLVPALYRVRTGTARVAGVVAATREMAGRVYVEFLRSPDDASDD